MKMKRARWDASLNLTRWPVLCGVAMGLVLLVGCAGQQSPFAEKKPFVATPVPPDFAVVLNENVDTYYARQHVHQVVRADDMMSRTTYTTYRDYNNTVADQYTQEAPVTQEQLQGMWNLVRQNDLLKGGWVWKDWSTNASNYRSNQQALEIRADGKQIAYQATNFWPARLRDLALQVEGARFGLKGANQAMPAGAASSTVPATATAPARTEPGAE
jgi:hypothetical protein